MRPRSWADQDCTEIDGLSANSVGVVCKVCCTDYGSISRTRGDRSIAVRPGDGTEVPPVPGSTWTDINAEQLGKVGDLVRRAGPGTSSEKLCEERG